MLYLPHPQILKIMKKWHIILSLALAMFSLTSCFNHENAVAQIGNFDLMGYWAVTEDSRYETTLNIKAYYSLTEQGNLYYYECNNMVGVPFDGQSIDTGKNFNCVFASGFELSGSDLNLMDGTQSVKFATVTITSPNTFLLSFEGSNAYTQTCQRIIHFK